MFKLAASGTAEQILRAVIAILNSLPDSQDIIILEHIMV